MTIQYRITPHYFGTANFAIWPKLVLLAISILIVHQPTKAFSEPANKESDKWTLQRCIDHAIRHNLQVVEATLNERMAVLMARQNKLGRWPSVNADLSVGESYGRSIDPTSNQFVTAGFTYNTLGVSSQTLLFGWFQRRNQIKQSESEVHAAESTTRQLQNDIGLNIATGYLRILLSREQIQNNRRQLELDQEQLIQTRKSADAGKLPELNVAQMQAQLSSDSAGLISALAEESMALLQLKALMNIDFDTPFDIQAPQVDQVSLQMIDDLPEPTIIYQAALKNQFQIQFNEWRMLAAKQNLAAARSARYPQIALITGLNSNFASVNKDITGATYIGDVPLGTINIGGTLYPVNRPDYSFQTKTRPLFKQYQDNLRANIGLGVSIPLFNGYTVQTNIAQARLNLNAREIAFERDKLKLKQDVYQAWQQARASSQQYLAAIRSEDAAKRAYDFASKRYTVGMITTFEYTSMLNAFYKASSATLTAKYDLIFKLKVLDYYLGNPIKL